MKIKSSFTTTASRQQAYDLVTSKDGMLLFDGFLLVPRISEVHFMPSGWVRVKAGRGVHLERITGHKTDSSLTMEIFPRGLLALFCMRLHEAWLFRPAEQGCRVERIFTLQPRRFAYLPLRALLPFFSRAIEKNNRALCRALEEGHRVQQPFPEHVMNPQPRPADIFGS